MLSIPYLTRSGPVGIKFRAIDPDDDRPKYLAPVGQKGHIYNTLAFFAAKDVIHVAEGEIDAITLEQAGLPAVAIPGASNWREHFARCFEGYVRVFIWADNDRKKEGSNPGWELARRIIEDVPQSTLVSLPENTDVNDLYRQGGAEALLSLISR